MAQTQTIHERAQFSYRLDRRRADNIRRYSRAPNAREKVARLLAEARASAVAYALDDRWDPNPLVGIDSGRDGAWLDWGDDRRRGREHAGWQLYAIAIRDLMRRGYARDLASTIASQAANQWTGAPIVDGRVPLAPWISVDIARAALRHIRHHSVVVSTGADPLVVAAWSTWYESLRHAPAPQIGRHARWLAAGERHRTVERAARTADVARRVEQYLAGLDSATAALYAESGARPACLWIERGQVRETLHDVGGAMYHDAPESAAALAGLQRSHDAIYHLAAEGSR